MLSAILPRLAAILAAWLVGEAAKRGITLDPAELTALMLAAYAIFHRAISARLNPGDATKKVLIEEDKSTVHSDQAQLRRNPR